MSVWLVAVQRISCAVCYNQIVDKHSVAGGGGGGGGYVAT